MKQGTRLVNQLHIDSQRVLSQNQKKVADYYLLKKKGGADKAQIQMHFTSSFFRSIIMRIQKIRRRMYAPQKLIPLSKIHADEKTSAMQDYDTRFYPFFQEL